jgi:hypothetical protein
MHEHAHTHMSSHARTHTHTHTHTHAHAHAHAQNTRTCPAANSLLEIRGEADSVATQYLYHSRSSMWASVEDLKNEMSRG